MDTAVVTGASRGVGNAIARRFAAEGVHVVLCARNGDELDAVVDDIAAEGGAATAVRADVRDEYDVERLMETAARAGEAGGIDFVAANAGIYHGAPGETPLKTESYTTFDDTLRINVRGVFATVREAVPHLTDDARVFVPPDTASRATPPEGTNTRASSVRCGTASRTVAKTPRTLTRSVSSNVEYDSVSSGVSPGAPW